MTHRYQRDKQVDRQYNDQSVLWTTTSVYLFGISWSLYCMSYDIRLLFTSLVSLDHSIVGWQTIQWPIDTKEVNRSHKSEDRQYNDQEILFGISWSLYCLFSALWLLFTSLVSLGHCTACSLIYERDTNEVNRTRKSENRKYNDQEIPKR
jgi:hypothetical protein